MNVFAEIISIGDELLAGYTVNTNAIFISQKLRSVGIEVKWITTISDLHEEILAALSNANKRAQVVIITGGLGPTPDDITKATICEYFQTELVEHPRVIDDLKTLIKLRGYKKEMLEKNRAQALVPKSAQIISNLYGTAPGIILKKNDSIFTFMPGVPKEMQAMASGRLLDVLKSELSLPKIETRIFRTTGVAEAVLHDKIKDILHEFPNYPVAYLPKTIGVDLRFRKTFLENDSKDDWLNFLNLINKRINKYIFSEDERNMEEVVFDLLSGKKLTMSVAESFTGGHLQDWITNVPGSSTIFNGGAVVYSNMSKISVLGVHEETIKKHGAVSEEVAVQMAIGAQKVFKSHCSISSTGIAGPGGGTEEKPVGLSYIAACYKDKKSVQKFRFSNDRQINKMRGAMAGLDMLRRLIKE